jgi:uncharacterized protein (TIGR03437 family)
VTGGTNSGDLPVTQDAVSTVLKGPSDAFFAVLDTAGAPLVYSSYFGGGSLDRGVGVALDRVGGITVVGDTASQDMAVSAGAPQRAFKGGEWDAWAMNLKPPAMGAVSAASFAEAGPLAPGSLVAAFGSGLAEQSMQASAAQLPTLLGGRQLLVIESDGVERLAPLLFVSPNQVNFLIPDGTRNGKVTLALAGSKGFLAVTQAQIETVAPALFSMNGDGSGVAAATTIRVAVDGAVTSQPAFRCDAPPARCVPGGIDLGGPADRVFLVLFGTGIRGRSSLASVEATIGGVPAEVQYAGPQSEYPGLDQVNVLIPPSLAGQGVVTVSLEVEGKRANPVLIAIR